MSDLHYYHPSWIQKSTERLSVDVCVYGASSAGVTTAHETRKRGKSVVLLQPGKFVGGLTTGGLGWTDYGRKNVIGGLARDFYRRLGKFYGKDEEFRFWPSHASAVFAQYLQQMNIDVRLGVNPESRDQGVDRQGRGTIFAFLRILSSAHHPLGDQPVVELLTFLSSKKAQVVINAVQRNDSLTGPLIQTV